jgi:DNA-binding CsgD family transcriptional regulator
LLPQHATAAIITEASGAISALAALFGLTAAERRIDVQSAHGRRRRETAMASGVSDGTVKTQLASIFGKTDTSDQRGLELLMRDLTPPVRPH